MGNKKFLILISLLALIFMFTYCSNSPIKFSTNEGQFAKSTDNITVEYTIKSSEGFYASLGFKLTVGKVNWEIASPKNETVFKGYMLYENGKVYRELTYPLNYMNGDLNNKEEVASELDSNGNKIDIRKVGYLQFDTGSISGKYTLKLKPVNAEGSYKVEWSDKFPRK